MELIEKQIDELETYKGKWTLLYFYRTGTCVSTRTFDTKEQAESSPRYRWYVGPGRNEGRYGVTHLDSDYLFRMAMPEGDL